MAYAAVPGESSIDLENLSAILILFETYKPPLDPKRSPPIFTSFISVNIGVDLSILTFGSSEYTPRIALLCLSIHLSTVDC
nr:MAG TPA: hypothetical protein [Caudoviricetes sp.]